MRNAEYTDAILALAKDRQQKLWLGLVDLGVELFDFIIIIFMDELKTEESENVSHFIYKQSTTFKRSITIESSHVFNRLFKILKLLHNKPKMSPD